jgi:hypothetical protein
MARKVTLSSTYMSVTRDTFGATMTRRFRVDGDVTEGQQRVSCRPRQENEFRFDNVFFCFEEKIWPKSSCHSSVQCRGEKKAEQVWTDE